MNNIIQKEKLRIIDTIIDNTYIEKKFNLADVRALRNHLLEMAYILTEKSDNQSLLVLIDSKITEPRILREWHRAKRTIRPEIIRRLNIAIYHAGEYSSSIKKLDDEIRAALDKEIFKTVTEKGTRLQGANLYYEILKILIYRWMHNEGPISSIELSNLAGCSYPTIADARKRLTHSMERYSDRTFKLKHFPE